jgi:hypothetical protein
LNDNRVDVFVVFGNTLVAGNHESQDIHVTRSMGVLTFPILTFPTWAYEQGEKSNAHTWLRKGDYRLLDGSWRVAMGGLRAVAETPADYEGD